MSAETRQEQDKAFAEQLEALNKKIESAQFLKGDTATLKQEREALLEKRRNFLRGAAVERRTEAA